MSIKTGVGLVEWARKCVRDGKHEYCYGTYCNPFTASKYAEKRRQYPKHYTEGRHVTYLEYIRAGKIGTDCVGLIKGYLWEKDGEIKYKRDNIPDVSAKGMYKACTVTGKVADSIPDIPGVLVFNTSLSHVGVYDGNGVILEAQNFKHSMQENPLSARRNTFTLWGLCPFIIYESSHDATSPSTSAPTGNLAGKGVQDVPTIRKGSNGVAVQICQRLLIAAGLALPKYGIDGDFGTETETALRKFQKGRGLTADGICGPKTWSELARI